VTNRLVFLKSKSDLNIHMTTKWIVYDPTDKLYNHLIFNNTKIVINIYQTNNPNMYIRKSYEEMTDITEYVLVRGIGKLCNRYREINEVISSDQADLIIENLKNVKIERFFIDGGFVDFYIDRTPYMSIVELNTNNAIRTDIPEPVQTYTLSQIYSGDTRFDIKNLSDPVKTKKFLMDILFHLAN